MSQAVMLLLRIRMLRGLSPKTLQDLIGFIAFDASYEPLPLLRGDYNCACAANLV